MKTLLLINPSSRGGRGKRLLPEFRRELDALAVERTEITLSSIEEAFERARSLDTSCYDTVAAAGGDGTIRAVGAGVLARSDRSPKLGVLYTGTSPDFCRFHKIPLAPAEAVKCLAAKHSTSIPVLTANGNPFFCSCNPGMGAEVAAGANKLRPLLGDTAGTLAALLKALLKKRSFCFKVNGREISCCNHLLITRMPFIASNLKLSLPSLKEEEYLIWYLQNVSLFQWPQILFKLYRQKPCGIQMICSGKTLIETGDRSPCPLEYDGDPQGSLPLEIGFCPKKLDLIVPSGEKTV